MGKPLANGARHTFFERQRRRFRRLPVARILRRLSLLPHVNFQENLVVGGEKIVIPLRGGVGIQHALTTDDAFVAIYRRMLALKPGGLVDVGANIGQTLAKFKALDRQRRYIGFEPNPLCVDYLFALIEANRFINCEIVPSGLSDSTEIRPLFLNDEIDSAATVIANFRPGIRPAIARYVSVFRLDDLAAPLHIRDIAIVKIDVEGFELEVLKGARDFIKAERPFIMCEILPVYDENSESGAVRASRQGELLTLLRGLDYAMARVQHASAGLEWIEDIEVHSDLSRCDYVFFPKENDALVKA